MILALGTGWLPPQIAALPAWFRAACHWTLFVRTVLPDGMPDVPAVTTGMTPAQKANVARARVQIAQLRTLLFPADE